MKVEAVLWSRKNIRGKYFIKIRRPKKEGRGYEYINTGYEIIKKDWNEITHLVRKSNKNHTDINNDIQDLINEYKNSVEKSKRLDFLEYFDTEINKRKDGNKYNDYRKHKVIKNHILKFLEENNKTELYIDEITIVWLESLVSYFAGLKHNSNTIIHNMSKIRHIYNQAIERDLFSINKNPFNLLKIKSSPTKNKGLSLAEFLIFEDINPFADYILNEDKKAELFYAKQSFFFQFYTSGMRVSDMLVLKWENINNNHIEYEMRKNKKKLKIPIHDRLIEILRFFLPYDVKQALLINEPNDIELYLSLTTQQKALFNKKNPHIKIEMDPIKYDLYNNNQHKVENHKEINHLMNEYVRGLKETKYIFTNFLTETDIEKLKDIKSREILINTHKIIQNKTLKYNRLLKQLQELLGLINTKISSHVARHTFTGLMIKNNMNMALISKGLAHSKLATTENYMKSLGSSEIYEELNKGFDDLHDNYFQEKSGDLIVINDKCYLLLEEGEKILINNIKPGDVKFVGEPKRKKRPPHFTK